MIDLNGNVKEFSTSVEAAMYLSGIINKPIESIRTGISKCCSGKQKTLAGGYKFYRKGAQEDNS